MAGRRAPEGCVEANEAEAAASWRRNKIYWGVLRPLLARLAAHLFIRPVAATRLFYIGNPCPAAAA